MIWTRVKNWITSCAHVHVRIPTTNPTPVPGLTVDKSKLVKKKDADSALGNAGMRFRLSQLWCIAKLIFMHGVRSLYTFLYSVSTFLRTFYFGIKCHLASFTVLFTDYLIFGGKWFHLVTIMRDKKAASPGGGGTLDSSDADDRMRASNKTPPQKPWINRKTIPGRISEPYMSKFPESIKRYKKKNKNIGNWISSCFFLHSTIWSYRGHLQIVQNTPKILRKSSQILTQKIPQSKVSNTKKSFDQPRQLKTGVPRPLGPQAPRSSRHAWKIRPTVVSQGIQRESTGNL